ncbi:MAG: restriction endonuclease subunit S [Planktothrix agardhii]|jgi:type I restriction enzyme S subunit|uniref:restriction endonuclease subunit S n=1 Tax=Planktothrix agardhii TaxID=1160 RepID=UPI003C3618EB
MKINMSYKIVPLSEVVYFQEGPGLRNWQYAKEGIPFLNIRTLTDEGFINKSLCQCVKKEEFTNKYEHFLLDEGDFVVSSSGTLGKLAEVRKQDLPIMLNTSVIRFRPLDTNILDRDFLKWFIKSPLYFRQIESASTGTAIKNYGPSHLKKMVIPLPPIASQRRIANILDKADEIIRKRKEAIALTEQLQKSIFLDMFGDPVINPKGWEKVKLAKISNIQGGLQVTKKRESNPIEVPYLRVANAYRDSLNLNQIKTIFVTQQELNKTSLKKGDILIVEGHGNKTEIGRSCVWDDSISNCVHQNHLIRVRVDDNIAESIYVSNFLNSIGGRSQLIKLGKTTSGLNTINTSNVKGIEILLPPIKIQKKYITIQETIFQYIQKLNQQQKESENLFNSLLQKAFKGEL